MDFYSQTDNVQSQDSNSTSGDVQPTYVRIPSIPNPIVNDTDQSTESEELTKEEEEKFYHKVMRTTLL